MHFAQWWTAPTIVAEGLTSVPDPLLTALRLGPPAPARMVAASIARSMLPAQDSGPAPEWLLPEQHLSFHMTLAAVRRYRGALLADPVGSGKTYIALAVAAAVNGGRSTVCLVPAPLLEQWGEAASRLRVQVELCSHQQASLGRLPLRSKGLVIIDESHQFRNRLTKRYRNVARWLVGRPALLVSATPIVNRLSDLAHQLLLAIRDNALTIEGIASLRELLQRGPAHPALGHIVVENDGAADLRPGKATRVRVPVADERRLAMESLAMVKRLRLSRSDTVATLIRGVMLRAASSSPGAFAGFLERYRRLLLHARDALRAGQTPERRRLRQFTAELGDQLLWWELLPIESGSSELELSDLDALDEIIPVARARLSEKDPKLDRLSELLVQERPTLVFTASRDTVRYIRQRLSRMRLAWCTGEEAGIAAEHLPRELVLRTFRDGALSHGPRHLIVTDVAAEGLDLQRAARVVHYDLPWTPMKLEQREGRTVRLGSPHREVEVLRFAPHPELDRLMQVEAALSRKAKLPAAAGLGANGRHIWRWRTEIAREFGASAAVAGMARVSSSHRGALVGISLHQGSTPPTRLSAMAGWLQPDGTWIEKAELITERLRVAAACQAADPDPDESGMYLELLTPVLRRRLALARTGRWISLHSTVAARQAAGRLSELIREAARLRDDFRLSQLERALAFIGGGHTSGEEMLLDGLSGESDDELTSILGRMPPQPEWDGIEVRLTGFIVFGPKLEAKRTSGLALLPHPETRSGLDPEPAGEAPHRTPPREAGV
ncbi:MAG TPA: helicase-related protein [Gemmatimonadales bacterium]|nr:helicase-related protein [Gemmatimonadales bacterium]